jgi:uracil-DNA glycosylase family 4
MLFPLDGCDSCGLKSRWPFLSNPKMPMCLPTQSSNTRVVVVGEGPGETEDDQGIQFVGTSGQLLRKHIPVDWVDKVFWQNIIRCRPPDNRAPKLDEMCCCSTYLEADFDQADPHAVLAVGGVALDYFWEGAGITASRGVPFPIQMSDGRWRWCVSEFHPSYVGRATKKDGSNPILPLFKAGLLKFFNNIEKFRTPPNPPRVPKQNEVFYPNSVQEVKNLFMRLKEPFGYDIETSKLKPYHRDARIVTAAFSDGELHFAFPVWWPGMAYAWGDEALAWCVTRNKHFIAHNAPFELVWNWWTYPGCDLTCPYEDTQARARVHYERKTLLSLDEQSRIHTGRNIKAVTNVDSKRILSYPLPLVLYYNALDAWSCWAVHQGIQLTPEQKKNYDRIIMVQRSTVTMEAAGLPVDLNESAKLRKDLSAKQDGFQAQAEALPEVQQYSRERKPFNIASPIDVGAVLVTYCGFQLPRTDGGNYSSAEDSLIGLLGKHPLVDLTLDYREVAKLGGTYVKPILEGDSLGTDGLIHSSYSATLVATGRLSSADPNVQNVPRRKHREIRRQIVAPPGFIMVSFDYGQLEARMVAMGAKDRKLIANFINHEDIHTRWMKRLLKLYPKYIEWVAQKSGETEEKALIKAARDRVKNEFVFASLYGAIANSIAEATGIPRDIVEELQGEFWSEYSEVRRWIDGQFQFYQENGYVETFTKLVRNEILPRNEVINTPVQGTSAHLVLDAQAELWMEAIRQDDFSFMPRLNVHDDVTMIFPDDSDLDRRINLSAKILVEPRYDFSICPLTTECKVGYNWCDLEVVGMWEGNYIKEAVAA